MAIFSWKIALFCLIQSNDHPATFMRFNNDWRTQCRNVCTRLCCCKLCYLHTHIIFFTSCTIDGNLVIVGCFRFHFRKCSYSWIALYSLCVKWKCFSFDFPLVSLEIFLYKYSMNWNVIWVKPSSLPAITVILHVNFRLNTHIEFVKLWAVIVYLKRMREKRSVCVCVYCIYSRSNQTMVYLNAVIHHLIKFKIYVKRKPSSR